ncbi:MAG TPA: CHRD domain-containing protein [Flavipsychrobacter sp.]|nr:CHRD domain-containing protein [Flavipsychrobacter sp.]
MKKLTQWLFTLLGAMVSFSNVYADHLTSKYLFAARMDGAQEVPAVTTNAIGLTTFYLSNNRDTLCIRGTFTGLSGGITAAHIHDGAMGVSGPPVIDLSSYISLDDRVEAVITGSSLTASLIAKMFNNELYINVHTAANPNGEIRGQLMLETDWGMSVRMDGGQEVPPVTTTGMGLGAFVLAQHKDRLWFDVTMNGLSSAITGAHLHIAPMGVTGPVVKDLTPFISGNRIMGSFDTLAFLSELMNDSIYINVHTSNYPNGEIRGQLQLMPYLSYDGHMNGAQEVPAVVTAAIGEITLMMNYTFDTLWYDAQVNGLSGTIADAHFHYAPAGSNGTIVVAIPGTSINGNVIQGYLTGIDLQDSFITHLNNGNIYFNVHTVANPSGEIRAQIYRTFREGYTFKLTGDQEVPMVTTIAEGSGMVSIDRDQTNAHVMIVTNDISPTMAHLHNNIPGQNGPVILDLMPWYSNGGVFGYWRDTATVAFDAMMSNKFRKDSVYSNYHTAANPNGEIRGNISRALCLPPTLSVKNIGMLQADIQLYPNPAQNSANLDIVISGNADADIQLRDVTGRTVWNTKAALTTGANRVNIPLNGISAGVYLLNLNTASGTLSYKLIKD